MYSKKVNIINKTGLHARPASEFVAAAGKFSSIITINKLDENGATVKSCPAKSIVLLLTMGLTQHTAIELTAEGEDEKEAIDKLAALIESGFGEV